MADFIQENSIISKSLPTQQKDTGSFYTLIVDPDNQGFDNVRRYIPLDLVKSLSVQSTSQVTSYPLLTGDIMSDHKYDEPKTISISGSFSLNGSQANNGSFVIGNNKNARLVNIENYFETIQKLGKTITLVTSGNVFKSRSNLIITNLSFNYGINNISFSMSLKEVYFFEALDIQVDEYDGDPNLPTLADFKTLDFSQDVISREQTYSMTINILFSKGIIGANFGRFWIDWGKGIGIASAIFTAIVLAIAIIVLKMAIASTAFASLVATTLSSISIPVVGWVMAGIGATIIAISKIVALFKMMERRKMIAEFRVYANKADQDSEGNRFLEVLEQIQNSFNEIADSNDIKCYGITSNTNKQEMYLSIDNNTYAFDFEKDTNGYWQMRVTMLDNTENGTSIKLQGGSKMIGQSSIIGMKKDSALFTTKHNVRVYLVNKGYQLQSLDDTELGNMLNDSWKSGSCDFLGYSKEEMESNKNNPPTSELVSKFKQDGIYKDLTKFELIVSDYDFTKLEKALKKVIQNALLVEK